jgi:glycosyltransferase involved in cell wall biosynthesis
MSSISVLIPVYNGKIFIESALKSLVNQNYKDFFVVICDDGSTDNSLELVNKYQSKLNIIIIKNETNLGIPKTLTLLINTARKLSNIGVYLAQDDYFPPNYLQEITKCFIRSNVVLVYTRLIKIDSQGKRIKGSVNPPNINIFKKYKTLALTNGNYITAPGSAFRLNLFEDNMLLGTNNLLHDWCQFIIYSTFGDFKICHSTNAYYRIHTKNLSKNKKIYHEDIIAFKNNFYCSKYFESYVQNCTKWEWHIISKFLKRNKDRNLRFSTIFGNKYRLKPNLQKTYGQYTSAKVEQILNIGLVKSNKFSIKKNKTTIINYLYTQFATIKMIVILVLKILRYHK